jgi:hypothetical protein
LAHLKYLESMKNPRFDYSTDKESNDLVNLSSCSEDDDDDSLKIENNKARKVILEQLVVVGGSGSSKHCKIVETYSSL